MADTDPDGMATIDPEVVAAQLASDQAWACLQAYRRRVDGRRLGAPGPHGPRQASRDWTDREHATYARLHRRVVAAADARRAAMHAHDITSTWKTERAIRAAAREASAT